jgi:microcin C transport system permease protein
MSFFKFNPTTIKRFKRFRQLKRAWWSLLILGAIYFFSLGAELFCGTRPLVLHHQGRWYFPLFAFHPGSEFSPTGGSARADYLKLRADGIFDDSFVLWPCIKNDPYRIISLDEIKPHLRWRLTLTAKPKVAGLTIGKELEIKKGSGIEVFLTTSDVSVVGASLETYWQIPAEMREALQQRAAGQACPSAEFVAAPQSASPFPAVRFVLAEASARNGGRATIRIRVFESEGAISTKPRHWDFAADATMPLRHTDTYASLPEAVRAQAEQLRADGKGGSCDCTIDGRAYALAIERESARFPFRPFAGHWLGLDDAGRDVFARIFYALRIALNFGVILVICSLAGGSIAGMTQGYLGGKADIIGQRLTEIWNALPFLYIMILMGSLYGTGFTLLLVCYALFNWIGISYYMRAETLRLKKMAYIEAAKCLGVPGWRIVLRHILPNALVPLVTFFPFSLVGAIGSLAALDYLGFGLPPPSPSLGELLAQAQVQRHAWWLILYPSLALFTVMLLGVFIGEGVRNAFESRQRQVLQ